MNKIAISAIASLLILLLIINTNFIYFAANNKTGFDYDHTWTKAICNKNVCRDFEIKCLNGEILEMKPITGFVVLDDDWVDERDYEDREKVC